MPSLDKRFLVKRKYILRHHIILDFGWLFKCVLISTMATNIMDNTRVPAAIYSFMYSQRWTLYKYPTVNPNAWNNLKLAKAGSCSSAKTDPTNAGNEIKIHS